MALTQVGRTDRRGTTRDGYYKSEGGTLMTWVLEEPLYIIIIGGIAVVMLGFAWYQVQWRGLLYAIIGVAALTGVLLAVEHWVVTDAEHVKDTLSDIARTVETNDLDAVLHYAAQGADDVRRQASAELPRYAVGQVKIKRNVKVTFDRSKSPPHAKVTFNVVVIGKERSMQAAFHVPRFVEMDFVEENGQWRVVSYRHWDPQRSMQMKVKRD